MPRTIVGPVRKLELSEQRHEPDVLRTRNLVVHFPGQVTVRLSGDDERFELYAGILEAIKGCDECQAFVQVDYDSQSISRLLLPRIGRVTYVSMDVRRGVMFFLDNSSRVYRFPGTHPRYREYLGMLSDLLADWGSVAVTEDEGCRQIVDLRPAANPVRLLSEKCNLNPPANPVPLQWVDLVACFNAVVQARCPSAGLFTCIPFQFPDNGCTARADQMCRILTARGNQPFKAWNFPPEDGTLVVQTNNVPPKYNCQVEWPYHVAAVLVGYGDDGAGPQRMILDPSLFCEPVTADKWMAKQVGSDSTRLRFTSTDPYQAPAPHTCYCIGGSQKGTDSDLVMYENQLLMRIKIFGAPPYQCP
jgi:hypothetical protein